MRFIGLSARPGYRLPWVGIIAIDLRAKERIFEENSKRAGVLLRRFQADLYIFILLSGKILRTGFPVQQFHICASRGFLTLMAAKAINGH